MKHSQYVPNTPIQPGETVSVKLITAGVVWETEQLSSVIRDADCRFGWLLFFFKNQGERYLTSVSAPLIPEYF
ncbi:MAG: methane monooxygenase/ammonia monooxygenase subunit B [Nitrospinales bacterium]